MKIYTIIGGVNGVGKSSLTGVLAAESNDLGVIIDTDKITVAVGGDKIKGGKEAIARIKQVKLVKRVIDAYCPDAIPSPRNSNNLYVPE